MCETSMYELFLQAVGLVTIAISVGALIFIASDPDPVAKLFNDKKGDRDEST